MATCTHIDASVPDLFDLRICLLGNLATVVGKAPDAAEVQPERESKCRRGQAGPDVGSA